MELIILLLIIGIMVMLIKLILKTIGKIAQRINAAKAAGTTQSGTKVKPPRSGTKKKRKK